MPSQGKEKPELALKLWVRAIITELFFEGEKNLHAVGP
jgi:hypothetical protein